MSVCVCVCACIFFNNATLKSEPVVLFQRATNAHGHLPYDDAGTGHLLHDAGGHLPYDGAGAGVNAGEVVIRVVMIRHRLWRRRQSGLPL